MSIYPVVAPFRTERMMRGLDEHSTDRFSIEILGECDSTNTELARRPPPQADQLKVLVAAHQRAGRGRRGRVWQSFRGQSLTFSCAWQLSCQAAASPGALPLVAGLAVARTLESLGLQTIALKWPNDILVHGCKLGGILVELERPPGRPPYAIIGCGLNLSCAPPTHGSALGSTDLASHLPALPEAEHVLVGLLRKMRQTLVNFAEEGFADLRAQWQARDAFAGSTVTIVDEEQVRSGICRGIDVDGALLLQGPNSTQRILSGDVSLRSRS